MKKYFIVAGEPSGDLHGSKLIKAIKDLNPNSSFMGHGGDNMRNEGMHIIEHVDSLAIMGFAEVLRHLPRMNKIMRNTVGAIERSKPDRVILIDYPGFNLRLAKRFVAQATIKVPCTPDGLLACAELSMKNLIRVNVTLIFDVAQAILAAKAGATYVSPFVGRLDDNSIAGLELIKDIDTVYRVQAIHKTRILSASIRYVNSVSQSFANGADIVTMPPAVFDKMYNHVLTDKGLEIFENDWKSTQTV